jgi:DNA polymerase-4
MPEKDRAIFLIDCDAFFASVAEIFQPELKKIPMAVCGNPENRHGIIINSVCYKQHRVKFIF